MGTKKKDVPPEETQRIIVVGRPDYERCDNKISTSKYNVFTFLPIAVKEQFRRVANMYFLIIGIIMAIGWYSPAFDSAISPWTTLGPLAIVISFSLLQEGTADYGRHKSDAATNNYPCVILTTSQQIDESEGKEHRDDTVNHGEDVKVDLRKAYFVPQSKTPTTPTTSGTTRTVEIAYQSIKRKDIRAGHLVVVRNREMVPADIILLASSSENGSAYIETSSIDGETNLKLRTSPHLPKSVVQIVRNQSSRNLAERDDHPIITEDVVQATRRLTRMSALAYPHGKCALDNPLNAPAAGEEIAQEPYGKPSSFLRRVSQKGGDMMKDVALHFVAPDSDGNFDTESIIEGQETYLAALSSESPNASVNTYSGVLTMPPVEVGGPGIDIPLNADNMLLRGAVLRNTEWAIGLACFTGTDTKLVQNSFDTPSKFSQLDKLMNWTVKCILLLMLILITILATLSTVSTHTYFDSLWYIGFHRTNLQDPWPYLPDLDPPEWQSEPDNWVQKFFLFVTLLTNFVPLSLYVTIEVIVVAIRIYINLDLDMYDAVTDTRALARSTTVTDLGQVQYVFSDKTGTLTQNVMRFKRCSVDGMVFGAPIEKAKPGAVDDSGNAEPSQPFHPTRQLLVGRMNLADSSSKRSVAGLEPLGGKVTTDSGEALTFNAEMFLRVMSLCHTVVVEKDLDIVEGPNLPATGSMQSHNSLSASLHGVVKKVFGSKKRSNSADVSLVGSSGEAPMSSFEKSLTAPSLIPSGIGKDGAPIGYAYQAESPDEGALVEAASRTFGFQLIGRDSSGIRIACHSPSLFQDERIKNGLKKGSISLKELAAETAGDIPSPGNGSIPEEGIELDDGSPRIETWSILAVNKFDSDRKRMSIIVRSPPEFGSIPIVLCKGADSSMLDPHICEDSTNILSGREKQEDIDKLSIPKPVTISSRGKSTDSADPRMVPVTEGDESDEDGTNRTEEADNWDSAAMLGIQSHLGTFASEGLRTLVLGMRVLTESQCEAWLEKYTEASTSINNREEKLTAVAKEIETGLHIVGATAIEDKLQRGVPETIKKLEEAGIKLWVLTGDKRETAIEIGYSTHVLTSKMHLTEVADGPIDYVRTQMAMEFMRLVKMGKLTKYQRVSVDGAHGGGWWEDITYRMGKFRRRLTRAFRRFYLTYICCLYCKKNAVSPKLMAIDEEEDKEEWILKDTERRKRVRDRAEKIIHTYLSSAKGKVQGDPGKLSNGQAEFSDEELEMATDEVPIVFSRAQSAREVLSRRSNQGKLTQSELRSLSLVQLTAQQASEGESPLVDEDTLSLNSFFPTSSADTDFDKKKRTMLERMFAVDHAVRHGRLRKHATPAALAALDEEQGGTGGHEPAADADEHGLAQSRKKPRALVIEGAALAHMLGDPELEELLFAVASCSDSVIACRVSPKQKALLVNLVRTYVVPEPITLAIGDGANDVGMIQEAHVGVGISGKEGQQAVNASDFAIAQFRFLEELLLIHGRWSILRQSTVVLFSFYKNAVMAGCLIVFSRQVFYSGTPLFDEWLIAMLNFVAAAPIAFLGFFDRCLEKDYVRENPEVYAPGRRNETITFRILVRWVILVFIHIFTIYYYTVPTQSFGGGITSAFSGLMHNDDRDVPGNGEGGDLKTVGTVSFTCLIILLGYKVLYESYSLIHGWWPALFTCCLKNVKEEGFFNRFAYTWVGVIFLSYGFYWFGLYVYMLLGRAGAGAFSQFVDTPIHVFHMRSTTWMLLMLVPTMGMVFDVAGKVYSNMFFPTQTQIHVEIAAKEGKNPRQGDLDDDGDEDDDDLKLSVE
jgi:magnesium-transporting ATPase (P-type)